ncbi:Uncharacterized protein GBIM_01381 [Gryllus bimaculatus]|nr:Uncharacterized protein GBIM_01381 [Gryllus bimaculatus]
MAVDVEELERRQDEMLAEEANQCRLRIQKQIEAGGGVGVCPPTWDGIMCWDGAEAGELCEQPCPAYITGFDPRCYSRGPSKFFKIFKIRSPPFAGKRHPTLHGDGLVHAPGEQNQLDELFEMFQPARRHCHPGPTQVKHLRFRDVSASSEDNLNYGLRSVVDVSDSSVLHTGYCQVSNHMQHGFVRKLRCPRNTLHMHLFLSFIMRAFMALLKHSLFVQGLGLPSDVTNTPDGDMFGSEFEENWECKLITRLPAVFVLAWVVCRLLLDDFVCWTVYRRPQLFLLVRVPIVASIIVRTRWQLNLAPLSHGERWAKSTLVLVPLFGVHYTIFIGLSYSNDSRVELAYLFCDQLFASFQVQIVVSRGGIDKIIVELSEAAGGRAAGERRWSSRSDYSVAGSALEMHSMDAGHI